MEEHMKRFGYWTLGVTLLLVLEYSLRDVLFEYSLGLIESIQLNKSQNYIEFFKIYTYLGKHEGIMLLLILIINFLPLSQGFIITSIYILSHYFTNLFKLIYQNPRPFYVDPNIIPWNCEGDYGNPSGHSFGSVVLFLSFWNYFSKKDFIKDNSLIKYSVLSAGFLMIFLIMYSRLLLGVHGLNQLLFGFFLGISLYFLFFHVLLINDFDKDFIYKLNQKNLQIICFVVYGSLMTISTLVYTFRDFNHDEYMKAVLLLCDEVPYYKYFETYNYLLTYFIFAIVGMHLGVIILFYFAKEKLKVNENILDSWDEQKLETKIFRFFLNFAIVIFSIIPYLAVGKRHSLTFIFVIKYIFPLLGYGISLFGLNPFISIYMKTFTNKINEKDLKEKSP